MSGAWISAVDQIVLVRRHPYDSYRLMAARELNHAGPEIVVEALMINGVMVPCKEKGRQRNGHPRTYISRELGTPLLVVGESVMVM